MSFGKNQQIDFPYLNLSLKNLRGEKWKDIRGYEGYYMVSNFGRIKSLERERPSRWTKPMLLPERIRRQNINIKQNKTLGIPLYTLMITLKMDSFTRAFSVGRLVYDAFIEKVDMGDRTFLMGLKDKDGRNLHTSNLYKDTIIAIKLDSYEKGRAKSHLSVLSKPVTQFDENGKPIAWYPSMYDAGKKTGLGNRGISEVANGNTHVLGGFFWKLGIHKKPINTRKIKKKSDFPTVVNKALMKRLKLKTKSNIPPFLDLSLSTLPGERWKDMPLTAYNGHYKISNFGRVKALAGVSDGKMKKFREERIKMLTIDFKKDRYDNETAGSISVMLAAKPAPKISVSVARLVYYLFREEFDLDNKSVRIYYKDNNSHNLHYKNLELHSAEWSCRNK